MSSVPSLAGRKRESDVWRYFTYDRSKNSSSCTISDAVTKSTCVQVISGKNPTNLKKHVQACHADVFKNLQQTESTRKTLKAKRLVHEVYGLYFDICMIAYRKMLHILKHPAQSLLVGLHPLVPMILGLKRARNWNCALL